MIEYFISDIRDPDDYMTLLTFLSSDSSLTLDQADQVLRIYKKHLSKIAEKDYNLIRLCILADMLPRITRDDSKDLKGTGFTSKTLDVFFDTVDLLSEFEEDQIDKYISNINNREIPITVRLLFARALMNLGIRNTKFVKSGHIQTVANFIMSCDKGLVEHVGNVLFQLQQKR